MRTPTSADTGLELAGESRYRLLVDAVMDYAIYLLDPSGRVSSWNPGAERFKGYAPHEIIGQHFSIFYTEEDRLAGVPERALETARHEGRFEAEGWRVHKSGRRFWCSVVIDAVRDDKGHVLGFAKITRDITDKKKAQDEIQATRDALHHAQKLEALGRLTSGVAHDFNNFLATIRFAAEMLRKPSLSEDKRLQLAGVVTATVERAGHLTAQLLAYSRKQPLTPARFDVRACIEGMRDIFAATVGSGIKIEYVFQDGPLHICADSTQLETALLNMVINARDAMPAGGQLRITVRREAGENGAVPDRPERVPQRYVAIELRDSGCGMEPDVLAQIFEPFFTTKPVGKGTGLGLSQVFGFSKQSGGDVRVASEVGLGSTFTLSIPEDVSTADGSASSAAADPLPREQKRIMLVDDDTQVGAVLRALLEDMGHEVSLCTGASAALQRLQDAQGAVDLVIADVELAGLDGMELAKKVRMKWPHIRVVLTTGAAGRAVGSDARLFPLLPKPWSMELLLDMLGQD
ncbi:PAS domain-containing sensor histidine kinase [Achromobacter marplatensis]|uniref:PAS domain-containing sensor histidine kinase n=1 Tax=Achromobacter marplatensis TaxID=470868 RepID=UPI0039F71843